MASYDIIRKKKSNFLNVILKGACLNYYEMADLCNITVNFVHIDFLHPELMIAILNVLPSCNTVTLTKSIVS